MTTIDNLIEKYKVQVLPQGAEDWAVICKLVAKEYAVAVIDEMAEEIDYYSDNSYSVSVHANAVTIQELKDEINGQ